MGALNPLFFVAAVAAGVPLFLHLFRRYQAQRVVFPALKYLNRTNRDHARRIRFRQLLLLLVRLATILLLVGAGARLFLRGEGSVHPPTALVIVMDNSMSSARVVGQDRVLDLLKARAWETLSRITDDDRVWILRAGEPWTPAELVGPADGRAAVETIEASHGRGDLVAAVARARELVATSGFDHREIHLLSDLQATSLSNPADPSDAEGSVGAVVVAWRPDLPEMGNHGIDGVVVGGGLPPLAGHRSEMAVSVSGKADADSHLPLRIIVDGRIRGATTLPAGATTTLPLPASDTGWVQGYVEVDPDDLSVDDRRYFAYRTRAAPRVSVSGPGGIFLEQALSVLADAGRLERVGGRGDLLVSMGGTGMASVPEGGRVVVFPPEDPTALPGLNTQLAGARIPWRYSPPSGAGTSSVTGPFLPDPLLGVEASVWYGLTMDENPSSAPSILAEVGSGEPWLVSAEVEGRSYLLVASPLSPEASTLPVSTSMVQLMDWVATRWAGSGTAPPDRWAGEALPAPRGATHVETPTGDRPEIDGTRQLTQASRAGLYTFLASDSVVAMAAVNPPREESDLTPADRATLRAALGPGMVLVEDSSRWEAATFRQRQGPELWWPLVLGALILLVVENLVAAGRMDGRSPGGVAARSTADASG
ncbi:MAG: BatA and WFA domain-containing protein [Gemmatimonadota bacterium]|nr:BatA and WFA domain-containing protein [Gemmatimonadota bacterium]